MIILKSPLKHRTYYIQLLKFWSKCFRIARKSWKKVSWLCIWIDYPMSKLISSDNISINIYYITNIILTWALLLNGCINFINTTNRFNKKSKNIYNDTKLELKLNHNNYKHKTHIYYIPTHQYSTHTIKFISNYLIRKNTEFCQICKHRFEHWTYVFLGFHTDAISLLQNKCKIWGQDLRAELYVFKLFFLHSNCS